MTGEKNVKTDFTPTVEIKKTQRPRKSLEKIK
jgi:hypothetical protein